MSDLTAKKCRGINLQARDCGVARWYPDPNAPAAWVEVWAVDADKPTTFEHAKLVGRFSPGQQNCVIEYNPASDRYKELRAVSYSAAGVPSVRYLDDAPAITVLFNRAGDAPTLTPYTLGPTLVQVDLTGFSSFSVARQVQIDSDGTFTSPLEDYTVEGGAAIAGTIYAGRITNPGDPPETRYMRVRQSSTGASGPWTAWSDTAQLDFPEEPL